MLGKEKRHVSRDRSSFVIGALLVLVTLLALGLRLYRLDAQSLWYDEGFSVYLGRMDLSQITERTAADIQPPLYYYLLHGWIGLLGDGEKTLRGLSLLFGVLTVPLIYAGALALFRSRLAGLLASLLVAVSPLHLWYSQEVRMYSLLTFLCLLSSYLLLVVLREEGRWRAMALWAAYTMVCIAALYTHYFAFSVLAFQGVYLLLDWWGRDLRPKRLLLGAVVSGMLILLAYVPWLPHLLTRFGADASYWPGQLKVYEVLLDIVLLFVGGESVTESVGIILAVGHGCVFAVCLLALIHTASASQSEAKSHHHPLPTSYYQLLFLLLYLLLPPLLILALSYNSPKFNARYAMLSHPALLLIVAGGLAVLWQWRSQSLANVFRRALAGVALVFVLGVSVYADVNAYANPAVARADFRGVARYIRRNIEPDETVILSSGHLFPVFDVYAPDVERHLLPESPTLDTTQTLDYSVADDLNQWLAGLGGVWVVLWQDRVVDPVGYLLAMLDSAGEEQPVDRTYAQVRLRHYRLPADVQFSDQPVVAHPAEFNFGNRLRLLGYTQTGPQTVTLFWEALQPLAQDYRVSLILRDTTGQEWGRWDGRPTAYLYPTTRWRPGQVIFGRYDLAPMPGTPPGDYGLDVGVYTEADPAGLDVLDAAGAPQGKRAILGAVRLSVPAVSPDQLEIPHETKAEMGDGLVLLGWDLDDVGAQPGDELLLTLLWSVQSQPAGDYGAAILLTDSAGQTLDAGVFPPTNSWHPTSTWLEGQAWRGQNTFRLPIETQTGRASLGIQLVDSTTAAALGPSVELATIQIEPTSRAFTPPAPQVLRRASFEDRVMLLGSDLDPERVRPGETLSVTLYWKALSDMDIPYTVFVHLLGSDGQVVSGHDGEPVGGTRPTPGWVPGEYITDKHEVKFPDGLNPGDYVLEVGLYDAGAPSMPRLQILGEEGQPEGDRVIFGPVAVR
jgi:4-amino-4-deoxy-L-arabinose transferase-like glycosyltransferase